jgi:hypothetical protein
LMFMRIDSRLAATRFLLAGIFLPLAFSRISLAQAPTASHTLPQLVVRQIKVLGTKDAVEIDVEASGRIVPETRVLTGPDRLVFDFPNAIPGGALRSQSVYMGEVKDLRVGLFQSKPPVTRLVVDLNHAESYQIFPYGRTLMIKMGSASATAVDPHRASSSATIVPAKFTAGAESIQSYTPARPPLEVTFNEGLLSIHADKVSLAEIMRSVQQRTGAQISLAPGAEQEKVVADLGPAPAQEVLAHLLNGSKFNFLILNAAGDPTKLDRVILTPRTEGGPMPLPPLQPDNSADQEPAPQPQVVNGLPHTAEDPYTPPHPDMPPDQDAPPQ